MRLYCVGGFALTLQYGLARQTSDIDAMEIAPLDQLQIVLAAAGQGSRLHKQHGLYIERVAIMTLPDCNSQIDRDDVKYLFRTVPLDLHVLENRYRTEQRPYLSNEAKHDLTLSLWMGMLTEE